jgi:hypothetical protein
LIPPGGIGEVKADDDGVFKRKVVMKRGIPSESS